MDFIDDMFREEGAQIFQREDGVVQIDLVFCARGEKSEYPHALIAIFFDGSREALGTEPDDDVTLNAKFTARSGEEWLDAAGFKRPCTKPPGLATTRRFR